MLLPVLLVMLARCCGAGWWRWEDGSCVVCSGSRTSASRCLHWRDWFVAVPANWLRAWVVSTNQNRVPCAAGTLSHWCFWCDFFMCLYKFGSGVLDDNCEILLYFVYEYFSQFDKHLQFSVLLHIVSFLQYVELYFSAYVVLKGRYQQLC